jgi:hypothetical protein
VGADRDGPRSAPPPVVTPAAADCTTRPAVGGHGARAVVVVAREGKTALPAAGMEEEAPADPAAASSRVCVSGSGRC